MAEILIVGLGNPGKKYQPTRHSLGFRVIDELAKARKNGWVLAKPKTFMNQSGKALKHLMASYQLPVTSLMVVHDDIDLPLGEFKIQKGRGAAGHKGVGSVIDELGTKDFWRVRMGICPKKGKPQNVEKFVLQKFTKAEEKIMREVIEKITKKLRSSPQL